MASFLRRTIVAVLLAAWSVPAMAANAEMQTAPIAARADGIATGSAAAASPSGEAAQYAAREKQAPGAQNFQGGAFIYIGGGVLAAALIVLLILVIL